jgi:hypothetical protein
MLRYSQPLDKTAKALKDKDIEKEASTAEILGLLTPAAIVAQPFIMDKINKHNDKKREQEEQDALDEENPVGFNPKKD